MDDFQQRACSNVQISAQDSRRGAGAAVCLSFGLRFVGVHGSATDSETRTARGSSCCSNATLEQDRRDVNYLAGYDDALIQRRMQGGALRAVHTVGCTGAGVHGTGCNSRQAVEVRV